MKPRTDHTGPAPAPFAPSRRTVLRAGALAALALPLAAACTTGYQDGPDPLAALAAQARADAAAATALAGAGGEQAKLAEQVAAARTAQAAALQSEVDRQNSPKAGDPADTGGGEGMNGLKQRLAQSRRHAEALVPDLPRYRAGLVAAVAAGCAALQRLSDQLGPGEDPQPVEAGKAGAIPAEAVDAMQQALAAEHAAIWVYGLVSAFLPANYTAATGEGATEHRDRRDACIRMLASAGATPAPAEAAYVPPKPVTDGKSAMSVVGLAEGDAAAAWRGVLEHTDAKELRTVAAGALTGSARRGTRWRIAAGDEPAALPLPGSP
ncbi:ferritin-like domain-containing protein [Amycolatopsis nigrescens]|uniref:ferritin-like domain-containing protein n=1 Tax=Amycolatopsis nigrescens TaxID=381445 RepID=UPI00035DF2A5|nr:ferritin-like domain-containing protein [Amycolatopsis nigrescens]